MRKISIPINDNDFNTESTILANSTHYKSLIGSLLFIANSSRPDVCFGVNKVARYSNHPTTVHLKMVQKLIRYLYNSSDLGMVF